MNKKPNRKSWIWFIASIVVGLIPIIGFLVTDFMYGSNEVISASEVRVLGFLIFVGVLSTVMLFVGVFNVVGYKKIILVVEIFVVLLIIAAASFGYMLSGYPG